MLDPLIFIAIALTAGAWWARTNRSMPLNIGASLAWWALILYMYVVMVPPLDITQLAYQFLFGALVLISFVPLLLQVSVSTKYEKRARQTKYQGGMPQGEYSEVESGENKSWLWDKKKQPSARDRQMAYKDKLRSTRRK